MEGTTNITQLPTDNVYSSENIVLETNDINQQGMQPPQGMQQPPQGMQQPPQGMQPSQGMQQPPQGMAPPPGMHQQPPGMQQQPPQGIQQPQAMQQPQNMPNVGGGASAFSRPSSPQINYNNAIAEFDLITNSSSEQEKKKCYYICIYSC